MGANNFLTLPTVPTGTGTGPRAAIDLWTLVPSTGLNPGFTAICAGDFQGTIGLEGSLNGINFAPIGVSGDDGVSNNIGVSPLSSVGGFSLGLKNRNTAPGGAPVFELSPLVVPDVVRYVRLNIAPGTTIFGPVTVTLGGEQNCDCSSGGGGGGGISPNDFQVIDNLPANSPHPVDSTKGHHILLTADFPFQPAILQPAATDDEIHTFYNGKDQNTEFTNNQYVQPLPAYLIPDTGVVSAPGQRIQLPPGGGLFLQWDPTNVIWIVKVLAYPDPVPVVNKLKDQLASVTPYDVNGFGPNLVGYPITPPNDTDLGGRYFGQTNLTYATGLIGRQGMLSGGNAHDITGSGTKSIADGSSIVCGELVGNAVVTLDPTGMGNKEIIQVVRVSLDAFTLEIVNGGPGAGSLYTFPASEARVAVFQSDGTDLTLLSVAVVSTQYPLP